jgi:hypothetical protein
VSEHLFRAFSFGRTAKGIFAVRLLHSAWRKKKRAAKKLFAVHFNLNAWQRNSLACVFLLAHGKQFFSPPEVTLVGNRYPVRYLCRALGQGARQRHILCRAFYYGAQQTYTFVAVRFLVAHDKVFFKKLNFALLFISPLQQHYFVLNISILYVS